MPRRAVDGSTKLSPVKRADGAAILHIDGQHHRRFQHLADRRGQAGAERDAVVLAMLQALDADLPVLGLDAFGACVVDGHEGRVVDAGLDQFLRKLRADARRRAVGID